jgi:hypothetical protein
MHVVNPYFSKVSWFDVREEVFKLNPELATIIDGLSPDANYGLYRAHYAFGQFLLERGQFNLPDKDGQCLSLANFCSTIQEDLAYNPSNPCMLVLNSSFEIYTNIYDQILPFRMCNKGSLFGLWATLDKTISYHHEHLWSVTAGARSVFMLPSISDASSHQKLQKALAKRVFKPHGLSDHWRTFVDITQSQELSCDWDAQVLIFSKSWFKHVDDSKWQNFYNTLYQQAWLASKSWRDQFILDLIFSVAQNRGNLKPDPYLSDTVKNLFFVAMGASPSFGFAADEEALPVSIIQEVYKEHYQLKNYAPLILNCQHFDGTNPLYYSIQMPTSLEFSPKSRRITSAMEKLREMQHIANTVIDEIKSGHLTDERSLFVNLLDSVDFNFFHTEQDKHKELFLAAEILQRDDLLNQMVADLDEIAKNSNFFRGCVQIK